MEIFFFCPPHNGIPEKLASSLVLLVSSVESSDNFI